MSLLYSLAPGRGSGVRLGFDSSLTRSVYQPQGRNVGDKSLADPTDPYRAPSRNALRISFKPVSPCAVSIDSG